MRFQDKTAVITGGSSGIGLTVAKDLLKEGASVIISASGEERGRSVEKELKAVYGEIRADFFRCDVGLEEDIKRLMDFAGEKYGRIDFLFNNAGRGVSDPSGAGIETATSEEWDRVLNVNLRGPFLCTKYALPLLKKSKAASVVNTASELGLVVCSDCVPYLASKGGLIHLTRALALELAPYRIRVNAVCPAGTDTPLFREEMSWEGVDYEENVARLAATYPLGRIGVPEDISPAVLYLASEESGFMTGQYILLDGGFTIR